MKLIQDNEGQNFIELEEDEWDLKKCYKCLKEIDPNKYKCFYTCMRSKCLICYDCQHNPNIRKMCPYEWTGKPDKPHTHFKVVGLIENTQ